MLTNKERQWLAEHHLCNIKNVEQFKHALTNEVFLLLADKNQQYIFKRLNPDARSEQDRYEELLVQSLASAQALTPRVIAANKAYKLQQYIEGELIDANLAKIDEFLAIQLHRIHQLPAIHAPKQRLFFELQRLKQQLPVKVDEAQFQEMLVLAKQLDEQCPCDTLCHGDLSLNNVLQGKDEQVYIIDWEYAVVATPAYDLAFCNCINQFSDAQAMALISSYHAKLAKPTEVSLKSLQKECQLYMRMFNYINELWALCFMDKS